MVINIHGLRMKHLFKKDGKPCSFCVNCGKDHRQSRTPCRGSSNHTHMFETIFDTCMSSKVVCKKCNFSEKFNSWSRYLIKENKLYVCYKERGNNIETATISNTEKKLHEIGCVLSDDEWFCKDVIE